MMPKHPILSVSLALVRPLGSIVLLAVGLVGVAILPTAAQPTLPPTPEPGSRDFVIHGRCNMSVTTLPDLELLWAGGISCNFTDPTASVVIYDPITHQSKAAGSLMMARYDHSALRLPDGRILIVGGEGPDKQPTTRIEIYDPSTLTSHAVGSLTTSRCEPSVTQLPDGDVLLAGGSVCPPYPVQKLVKTIERFNVRTGYDVIVGEFRTPRYLQDATLLKDGRVLFTSGVDAERNPVSENEIYDPANNKVTAAGTMTAQRCRESIVPLPDGTVLFAGGVPCGRFPDYAFKSAEIFDPRTDQFLPIGEMTSARYCPSTVLLKDGRVLLAGGANGLSVLVSISKRTAELYDPKSRTFSPTGNLTASRTCSAAKLRPDGTVLIQRGFFLSGAVWGIPNSEIYDPVRGEFTALREVPATTEPTAPSHTLH
jgi:Galactose oxidase, central domain